MDADERRKKGENTLSLVGAGVRLVCVWVHLTEKAALDCREGVPPVFTLVTLAGVTPHLCYVNGRHFTSS